MNGGGRVCYDARQLYRIRIISLGNQIYLPENADKLTNSGFYASQMTRIFIIFRF